MQIPATMSDYKYTVRADWLDPIVNAVGNLFEDIRGADNLFLAGRDAESEKEAKDACARFSQVAFYLGAEVEFCHTYVWLGRIKCSIALHHPSGGSIRMTYSPRLV